MKKICSLPINQIQPNPEQPRREFNAVELRELADSIHESGLIQPIVVVQQAQDAYILISGERRLRACKLLGLSEIDAIVRGNNGDRSSLTAASNMAVMALAENLLRAELRPSEEARGYARLSELGLSNTTIAHKLGVSNPRVVSRLAMLELEDPIQDLMDAGLLPVDQRVTKALLSVKPVARVELAQKLARPGLRIQTVIIACEHFNAAMRMERDTDTPALKYVVRQHGPFKRPEWDALHQLGHLPPYDLVVKAAIYTCETCILREEASVAICGPCPVVVMLGRLIEETKK